MEDFMYEDWEEPIVYDIQDEIHSKTEIKTDITEKQEVEEQEVTVEYMSPLVVRYMFTDDIKEELIKQSLRSLFRNNPKFRPDDTLVLTVFQTLKAIFINNKNHILLKAPTGSGKTIIGFSLNYCIVYICQKMFELMVDGQQLAKMDVEGVKALTHQALDNRELIGQDANGNMFKISTATGKPVIIHKYTRKLAEFEELGVFNITTQNELGVDTYLLTSSKMLQEQIDSDVNEVFNLAEHYQMLKGSGNYECTMGTERTGEFVSYADRECLTMNGSAIVMLPCYQTCPYRVQRLVTSEAQTAVFNYFYFLNVLRKPNPFFTKRTLTIADEGHLLAEIVLSTFNVELTNRVLNNFLDLFTTIRSNFPSAENSPLFKTMCYELADIYKIFLKPITGPIEIKYKIIRMIENNIVKLNENFKTFLVDNQQIADNSFFQGVAGKKIKKLTEFVESMELRAFNLKMGERLGDLLIENNNNGIIRFNANMEWFNQYFGDNWNPYQDNKIYSYSLRDLSESALTRENFLTKTDLSIHMSATFSNMDNHAINHVGLNDGEYQNLILPPIFTYKNSPIYLQMSGFLNHANFDSNIDAVLADTIDIAVNKYPNEQGIIHTATFKITQMLQEKVESLPIDQRMRFLFYTNSREKEEAIKLMYVGAHNMKYIICGPSLYEGLDLKHDKGRFNIMVKVPYGAMSEYTKAKMERYPDWYQNATIEKVLQGIGRTDRDKDDWSHTYLMDSGFKRIMNLMPDWITKRLTRKQF